MLFPYHNANNLQKKKEIMQANELSALAELLGTQQNESVSRSAREVSIFIEESN
jgi:hypothetical protein